MTLIGLRHLLAGYGARLSAGDVKQRSPTNGRQGKSAASGRAQVVGWVECFRPSGTSSGWRFTAKPERFQRLDRQRPILQPASPS
jgi:hypothetical protein